MLIERPFKVNPKGLALNIRLKSLNLRLIDEQTNRTTLMILHSYFYCSLFLGLRNKFILGMY